MPLASNPVPSGAVTWRSNSTIGSSAFDGSAWSGATLPKVDPVKEDDLTTAVAWMPSRTMSEAFMTVPTVVDPAVVADGAVGGPSGCVGSIATRSGFFGSTRTATTRPGLIAPSDVRDTIWRVVARRTDPSGCWTSRVKRKTGCSLTVALVSATSTMVAVAGSPFRSTDPWSSLDTIGNHTVKVITAKKTNMADGM